MPTTSDKNTNTKDFLYPDTHYVIKDNFEVINPPKCPLVWIVKSSQQGGVYVGENEQLARLIADAAHTFQAVEMMPSELAQKLKEECLSAHTLANEKKKLQNERNELLKISKELVEHLELAVSTHGAIGIMHHELAHALNIDGIFNDRVKINKFIELAEQVIKNAETN